MPHDLIYDSALCPKSLSIRTIPLVILIFVVPTDQIELHHHDKNNYNMIIQLVSCKNLDYYFA
jgi:hypothetical protein